MEMEENLGVKLKDIKEPKLEKEVEQKSFENKRHRRRCAPGRLSQCATAQN